MENIQTLLKNPVFNELLSYVNWKKISECQDLSEDFIREFQDKIDWKKSFPIKYCKLLL